MPAMEGDRERPLLQKLLEPHQASGLIGQDKGRHLLARLRRGLAGFMLPKPRDQAVDCLLEMRSEPPHRIGKGLQALAKRSVHVARLDEGGF